MSDTKVGIHQANFVPWLGYFSKIACSDVFVVLDDALFSKKGGNWSNRVMLRSGGEPRWHTVPVRRGYHGFLECRQIEINETGDWRRKLLQAGVTNYGRSRYFEEAYPLFERVVNCQESRLVAYNLFGIRELMEALGLDRGKLRLASELDVGSVATQRLIDLTRSVGGKTYLCGGGSNTYLEEELFEESGVELVYHDFAHPRYEQHGIVEGKEFAAGLSIFDAIFSVGIKGTGALLG